MIINCCVDGGKLLVCQVLDCSNAVLQLNKVDRTAGGTLRRAAEVTAHKENPWDVSGFGKIFLLKCHFNLIKYIIFMGLPEILFCLLFIMQLCHCVGCCSKKIL